MFGENTDESLDKMQEQIDETHELFKSHIKHFRDELDIEKVATGEYWYGTQARELNLVDAIQTSDDYIMQHRKQYDIFHIQAEAKKSFIEKLTQSAQLAWNSVTASLPLAKHEDKSHL